MSVKLYKSSMDEYYSVPFNILQVRNRLTQVPYRTTTTVLLDPTIRSIIMLYYSVVSYRSLIKKISKILTSQQTNFERSTNRGLICNSRCAHEIKHYLRRYE